jgi:uncharacterized protein (DUF2062 family)
MQQAETCEADASIVSALICAIVLALVFYLAAVGVWLGKMTDGIKPKKHFSIHSD